MTRPHTRRADRLSDATLGRTITIGPITGVLVGLVPRADRITLRLDVDGMAVDVGPVGGGVEVVVS